MIRLFSTFTGIGWFELWLQRAGVDLDIVWYSEIDKYAIDTYNSHFTAPNFWDISKIDISNMPDFDLLTWWFPCQDVSVAGKQSLEWGRTVLVEYLLQMLEVKKPKNFIFENVKGLLSKKFDVFFKSILQRIEEAGYNFTYKVLNTKEHWVPQNRQRVFIIWQHKDYGEFNYQRPQPQELMVFLKDILEEEVDEKYYLSNEAFEKLKVFESNWRTEELELASRALTTMQWWHRQPKIIATQLWNSDKFGNSTKEDGTAYTLRSSNCNWVIQPQRIRKLTPIECERLQDFEDNRTIGSNTQRYKQCWNAVSVNVIEKIMRNLYK